MRSWPDIQKFTVCEFYEVVELCNIRVKSTGNGTGTKALQLLQTYSVEAGVPIILKPCPDERKATALFRFYRRLGFRKARKSENQRFGDGWNTYWIWHPKI